MPQSFHYNNKEHETNDSVTWMTNLANEGSEDALKSKIILSWRQEDSLHSAQNLYPLVDNRLVPDVAFMIGPIEDSDIWTSKEKVDFLFLLRNDHESIHNEKRTTGTIEEILSSVSDTNITYELVDWWDHPKFHNDSIIDMPGPNLTYQVL